MYEQPYTACESRYWWCLQTAVEISGKGILMCPDFEAFHHCGP